VVFVTAMDLLVSVAMVFHLTSTRNMMNVASVVEMEAAATVFATTILVELAH
jgi:hypothetical protein